MDRRELIEKFGAAGVVAALAGCIGVSENDDGGGSTATTEGPDDDPETETTTEEMGPTGTATLWFQRKDSEVSLLEDQIASFNERTEQTVEGSNIAQLREKTTSAIPAGQGPQVFEWAHDWVGEYHENGFLSDQSDAVDVDLGQFTEAAQGAIQFDGNLYGLPVSAETIGLVYNEDMVDSPPETLSEMVEVMEANHDPENDQFGLSYPLNPYFLSAWAQAFGGHIFDPAKDPALGIDMGETIEGMQLVLDELVPYMPNDPGYEPQVAAFGEGNAPFAFNGPWFMGTVDDKGIDAGVAALPEPDGGSPTPFTGIKMLYFASGMEENEGAAAAGRAFAEWYSTNEDVIKSNADQFGEIPVLSSVTGSSDLPETVQGYSQAVAQGTRTPVAPRMGDVWGPLGDGFMKAYNGDADLQDAMEEAAASIRSNWE